MDKTVFDSKVRALSRDDYYQSPDFQCAQTGGYPTMLCINWDEEKAWLKPNEFVDPCGADVAEYEKLCADFGIRLCSDIEDFNGLLKELGPDAVENATLFCVIKDTKTAFSFFAQTCLEKRCTMNSFMSWVGGKKALRDEIVLRFPPTYSRYIEVFGGGGWVLFHKSPGKEMEVYNDFNPNLANLFRCVRDHPNELCDELRYTLNSRLDFDYVREMLHTKTELPDIRRAAYFYQIIRESYASGLDSFGAQPHSMWNNFPLIHDACGRLQKVVIENKDFEKLIKQYDRPEAFFYCDPPYYNTEDYYEDVGFTRADHERLANALLSINGFFLLSYNDCPEIRELYSKPGITIEGTTRLSNIAQRYEGGKQYAELIISNYDTMARLNACKQLTLFDIVDEPEQILKERKLLWK